MAADLAERNISVNAVLPGYFPTSMTAHLRNDDVPTGFLADHIPLRRMGRPEEIGAIVTFLGSRAGAYMTGALIPVDGGIVGCR